MRRVLPIWLLLLTSCGSDLDSVPRVTPQELHDALGRLEAMAVDVRSAQAYQLGHIKGAALVPLSEVEVLADDLPRDRRLVTYCS